MHFLGEFLGYLAGICTAITFLPQSLETLKTKNVKGLSATTYIIYVIGMISWILYGAYLHSFQMILFNSISFIFAAIILCLIIRHKMTTK